MGVWEYGSMSDKSIYRQLSITANRLNRQLSTVNRQPSPLISFIFQQMTPIGCRCSEFIASVIMTDWKHVLSPNEI